MKHIANAITAVRIVAAMLLLFPSPLSVPFFAFYTVGGGSDMIDGTVARKLRTTGRFGAQLDSIADLLFFFAAAIKLLPALWASLPVFALWAVGVILAVKGITAILGVVRFRKLCFPHTYMNKLTGVAVFLFPYFFQVPCFSILTYVVCGIAFLTATEEFFCVMKMKEYSSEVKGIFLL